MNALSRPPGNGARLPLGVRLRLRACRMPWQRKANPPKLHGGRRVVQ